MSIIASIQARTGSTRLPGKVLREICGVPLLQWQIERLKRSRLLDQVIVATTTNPIDDQIETLCQRLKIDCYRGSEDDVLSRIASLVQDFRIDIHVECFGDSPIIDPHIVDEFIGYYLKHKNSVDYVSSALKTTYPPGMEVTLYAGETILKTDQLVDKNDPLREHAGFNISRFPKYFRIASLEAPPIFYFPDIYLEVDTAEDLEIIRAVISHFVKLNKNHFTLIEILDFVQKNSALFEANREVERKWKALRRVDDA